MCPSRVLYQFTTRSKRVLFRNVVLARVSLEPCIDDFVLSLEELIEMRGHRGLDHAPNKRDGNSVFAAERPLTLIEIPFHGTHALGQVRTNRDRLGAERTCRLKVPGSDLRPHFVVFDEDLVFHRRARSSRKCIGVELSANAHGACLRVLHHGLANKFPKARLNEIPVRADFDECLRRALILRIPIDLHHCPIF